MTTHKIAVIAGDGIGKEVVPAAIECLDRIAQLHTINLEFTHFGWGSDYYVEHGRMMPPDGLEQLRASRCHLPGRCRLSGGSGRRIPVGTPDPHPT